MDERALETRDLTRQEAKQIDNEPGYSAEQLDQMAGYYGTDKQGVEQLPNVNVIARQDLHEDADDE